MNDTFGFLGIKPVNVGEKSRFCVRGKAGVVEVLHEDDRTISFDGNSTAQRAVALKVGDCTNDGLSMQMKGGVSKHAISPTVENWLRTFYAPYNRRLYRLLGRDLGW